MPLTPEDVANKRFTPVRLREGYDMGEVDQFLDEIEAELARLHKENDDLRSKLQAAQAQVQAAAQRPPEPPRVEQPPAPEPLPPEPVAPPAPIAPVAAAPVPAHEPQTIRVETVADASNAAARLLELATRNADQLVEDAKNDADRIIGEARTKAERLESEAKVKADRLEAAARSRSQMLDTETTERRKVLFGDLEKERDKLSGEVETLRSFEREYRSRLKTYFSQQLAALNNSPESVTTPVAEEAPAPKRLRSVFGDDEV